LTTESRQIQEGAFKDEMDQRVESLEAFTDIESQIKRMRNFMLTSQTKVARSCHRASSGKNVFAAVDAVKPIIATPAREYADVAVKNSG
jgi:hypothetical protein